MARYSWFPGLRLCCVLHSLLYSFGPRPGRWRKSDNTSNLDDAISRTIAAQLDTEFVEQVVQVWTSCLN